MENEFRSRQYCDNFIFYIDSVLRSNSYRFLPILFLFMPYFSSGQEIDYDSLLQRIDTIENPIYKPVVSFSYGVLNFRGDVRNNYLSASLGNPAGKVSVATFIDRNHHFVANFGFMLGRLKGNEYGYTEGLGNLNFQTDLYSIGVNVEYRFGHFIPASSLIRPYISVGVENLNFSSKGDLLDANGLAYNYWSDGTIRDREESSPGLASMLYRDYKYETDLRLREKQEFGLGTYNQRSISFPVGLGVQFKINTRAFFSLGMYYHYTLTDFIDNVALTGTSIQGTKGNDSYVFSHLTLHFDLFSDPTTRKVDLLYAEVEFDPLFFDDEDGDFVLDVADHCPGTPYGVQVDTIGCPLDGDRDGVPDYLDKETSTASGVWVDEEGVTLSEVDFQAIMQLRNQAMPRDYVNAYLEMIKGEYELAPAIEIPERFSSLDEDGDGYISFEELLKTIDEYFDFQLDLSLEELRQVNEFFFSQ